MMHEYPADAQSTTPCLRCGVWRDEWEIPCVPDHSPVWCDWCYGAQRPVQRCTWRWDDGAIASWNLCTDCEQDARWYPAADSPASRYPHTALRELAEAEDRLIPSE